MSLHVFGFIITALVYAIGKVSGCHINPAVTFALAITKRMPWKEVPLYWGAQWLGAVVGALGIWAAFGSGAVALGMGQTAFSDTGGDSSCRSPSGRSAVSPAPPKRWGYRPTPMASTCVPG